MLRSAPQGRKIVAGEMDDPARDLEPYSEPTSELVAAVFSSVSRQGEWLPPEDLVVRAWFGSARLDFTQALLAPGVTVVDVSAVFGSVEIIVPADLEVDLGASALLGSVEQRDAGGRMGRFIAEQIGRATGGALGRREPPPHDPDEERPLLRIEGHAVFGNILVKTR